MVARVQRVKERDALGRFDKRVGPSTDTHTGRKLRKQYGLEQSQLNVLRGRNGNGTVHSYLFSGNTKGNPTRFRPGDPRIPKLDRTKPRDRGTAQRKLIITDAFLEALHRLGSDGKGKGGMIGYFMQLASKDYRAAAAIACKLIPTQVTGADGGPVKIQEVSSREEFLNKLFGFVAAVDDARAAEGMRLNGGDSQLLIEGRAAGTSAEGSDTPATAGDDAASD